MLLDQRRRELGLRRDAAAPFERGLDLAGEHLGVGRPRRRIARERVCDHVGERRHDRRIDRIGTRDRLFEDRIARAR